MDQKELRIHKTAKMIKRWHGKNARMRELTPSHRTLTIVLYDKDWVRENLVISCIDPVHVCAPFDWPNCHIEMVTSSLENGEEGFLLLDKENQVRISTYGFDVHENCQLR